MNPLLQPTVSQNVMDLVLNAGLVAKIVLGILLLFSLVSWAIILDKMRVFRRVRRDSDGFLRQFRKQNAPKEILQASRQFGRNPFAAVFKDAYRLFSTGDGNSQSSGIGGGIDLVREQRAKRNYSHEELVHLFDSVATREVLELEKNLTFLATTGSVSPFFGLFGTVWGVMSAFLAIGFTGSADLSVVAPGIAEALITTVSGLGAAIPAVIAYNYFVSRLKRMSAEIEIFHANLIETFARRETHGVR